MQLSDVQEHASRLGPWAHVATTGPDGAPHVVPVHPCWEGETLWAMVDENSKKVRNLASDDRVCVHYQVAEETGFDSLVLWGTATMHTDLDTKRRLWEGVFDYDLNTFAPGGPENSPGTAFMAIHPSRAVYLKFFGMQGREVWQA
jgi:general stress protein 26